MRKVLVLGGDSLLGSKITKALSAKYCVRWTTRRATEGLFLDALHPKNHDLNLEEFHTVVNVIGMTSFVDCDKYPLKAAKINVDFPVEFASQLNPNHQKFIQLSSSAVFSCETPLQTDESPKLPKSEYGKQKLNAEENLKSFDCVKILRLSKIVTPNDIIGQKLRRLQRGESEVAFCDLFFCPLDFATFCSALCLAIERSTPQALQISSGQDLNYFEALQHLCTTMGIDGSLLVPQSCSELVSPNNVLRYTSMLTSKVFEPVCSGRLDAFSTLERCYV